MVVVAIRALNLEYLVKILNLGRSRYIFYRLPTPTPLKIPSDSDSADLLEGHDQAKVV
jgi:hypothetical protein